MGPSLNKNKETGLKSLSIQEHYSLPIPIQGPMLNNFLRP
jgi:hypothetical protein